MLFWLLSLLACGPSRSTPSAPTAAASPAQPDTSDTASVQGGPTGASDDSPMPSGDSGPSAPVDTAQSAPNVLVIFLDDVGADQLLVFDGEDDAVPTPALAALADQGVRYPFAYAYPTCSPSRAALITGVHGDRNGITQALRSGGLDTLSDDVLTYPEHVRAAGAAVATAWIGKWHMTPPGPSWLPHPNDRGFDHFAGTMGSLYAKFDTQQLPTSYFQYEKVVDGIPTRVESSWATTDTVDDALASMASLPEPWFVVVAPHAAHHPFHEPPDDLVADPFAGDGDHGAYRRMIQAADTEIGRLIQGVDLGRTVVVYMGDNGVPNDVVGSAVPPDAAKGRLLEGGVRVGLIAAGPGIPVGARSDQLISVVDVVPTAAELQGVPLSGEPVDGVSLVPSWRNGDLSTPVRPVVKALATGTDRTARMARSPDYKLLTVQTADDYSEELFDLRGGAVREGDDLLLAGPLDTDAAAALEELRAELLPVGFPR